QEPLDFARLDSARDAVARALVRRLPELPTDIPEGEMPTALDSPFRIRAVTYSARQVAGYALLATGAEAPELDRSDIAHPQPARAGTAVGIVGGALLVTAIGTHEAVLWGVLPVAILLAAYAPRAISFAAGQAGFTVVLFVLFNIIQPVGWRVGVVRVEDVAIG